MIRCAPERGDQTAPRDLPQAPGEGAHDRLEFYLKIERRFRLAGASPTARSNAMLKISGNLSRRALMAGARVFAVAASLPPTIAAASVLPHSGPALSEDANLLALGEEIDPLLNAYRAAAERKRQARVMAEALCPPLPDELVRGPKDEWASWCVEREVDVEGQNIWPPDYLGADGKTYARRPREILKADLIKKAIAESEIYASRRSKRGKEIWRLIGISEKYEAERAAAIERSGVLEAADHLYFSAVEIEVLAYEVRKHEPVTMIGIVIQARALAAHAEAELDAHGFVGRSGTVLGRELAASVLRIAGGSRGVS